MSVPRPAYRIYFRHHAGVGSQFLPESMYLFHERAVAEMVAERLTEVGNPAWRGKFEVHEWAS